MEQNQENIHYRTGGRLTHCGVECLPNGADIERIVIERIEYKEQESINGRVEQGVWIAYFAKNPYTTLPFILNATNRKRLVKQFPECDGYPARLKNIAVRLTKERCRDVQDGGETWGLRISKTPASEEKAPKKKVIQASQVGVIVDWAREKRKSFDDIADIYDFENEKVRNAVADGIGIGVNKTIEDLPE